MSPLARNWVPGTLIAALGAVWSADMLFIRPGWPSYVPLVMLPVGGLLAAAGAVWRGRVAGRVLWLLSLGVMVGVVVVLAPRPLVR